MASTPKIYDMSPFRVVETLSHRVVVKGEDFDAGVTIYIGTTTPAVTFVSPSELRITIAASSLSAGNYDVRAVNADGGRSNTFVFEVEQLASAAGQIVDPEVDQRVQPLPVGLDSQPYPQRIAAASQFDGSLPDAAQGLWKDGSAPTQGGRWRFAEDVKIEQITFRSDGVEPGAGRTAGSGIFLAQDNGAEVMVFNLDNTSATTEHMYLKPDIVVRTGEELIARTFGATLEMAIVVTARVDRPYL